MGKATRQPRYRLRTLLIVVTLACVAFALLGRLRAVGSATLNGSQVVVFRSSPLGGVGLSSDGKSVTATFDAQTVLVDAKRIDIVGLRTVQLPPSWARLELIRTGNDVQILLDGTPLE
jgi:hypothetical protein